VTAETIVCATRGGASSRAVQKRAITIARDQGKRLVFLYVIDPPAIHEQEPRLVAAVKAELAWIGRTLLNIASARAEAEEVAAEITIQEGQVRDEICTFLRQQSAELLLMGAPRGTSATIIGDDAIEQFAAQIERETGVPVEIVRVDEA
jgi:nucleotide-binding universal stress UspA family protein